MSFIHTIIISIVEGLTEFLPISSTAHMDIVRGLLSVPSSEFIKSFEIIIQLGAILAVAVIYSKKVFSSWLYIRNLIIAFIPTGIIGFILYKIIKSYLLGNILVEAIALLLGGVIIILFENHQKKFNKDNIEKVKLEDLTVKQLLTIGTAQTLAVIPGVSRSGAVIISGRALGLGRELITEFSFLLAVPTMLLATLYDIYKSHLSMSGSQWGSIFTGFVISFIVALVVIKWFLGYIKKHTFKIFGWYRIILGVILLIALFFKVL